MLTVSLTDQHATKTVTFTTPWKPLPLELHTYILILPSNDIEVSKTSLVLFCCKILDSTTFLSYSSFF
jgi:hypothetical protein